MIQKIINELKIEYGRHKVTTVFMGAVVLLAILNYLKPSATSGILNYIGISIINFSLLSAVIVGIWYFWWRRR